MALTVRLALRDWDWLTPILLGDIKPSGFTVAIERVGTLIGDLASDPGFDGAEMSFSRYAQRVLRAEAKVVALPHFLMRGFRHRCIITSKASTIDSLEGLAGKAIGLAGWQDSGNTWTRALLRRKGVGVKQARWWISRLSAAHPITDRIAGFGRPGLIETVPGDRPLLDMLEAGELDAVFTPFMPPGFFAPESRLRPLLADYRAEEVRYFREVGYVPGIHLLGLKQALVAEHPTLPAALSELLDESARMWLDKREKYADTTPWIIDELARCARDLPPGWDRNGLAANATMIEAFATELHQQGIAPRLLTLSELFPTATLP
jgi:4,5-dihydroxyphthalate decarboxylase